jgi:pimeloyl-ACP methyl ester carboxylesterase
MKSTTDKPQLKTKKLKHLVVSSGICLSILTNNSQAQSTAPTGKTKQVNPFKITVEQSVLDDLKNRLKQTRWPDADENAGWTQGTNKAYLQQLVNYWINTYDWKKQEALLNSFPQFTVEIDGTTIHFLHIKGKGKNAKPLILTHGWPDSFFRFHKIIPLLTNPAEHGGNPEQSFDLIIPSIPGFGFSERKPQTSAAVADLWKKLMTDVLGYKTFLAAGGDVGSSITKSLALRHPNFVEAIHLTDVGYPTGQEDFSTMTKEEQEFAGYVQGWWFKEGAYSMVQMTKPQSLAYSLNDSPAGWAAWVLSFGSAGAPPELIEKAFGGKDELLTNIMIYWVTQTIGSSARMYLIDAQGQYGDPNILTTKSTPPAGISLFPREAQFPEAWAARSVNVSSYRKVSKGGHFAALEEPEIFAEELRTFFYRKK